MQILEVLEKFVIQLEADGRGWSIIGQYRRHVGLLDRWLATGNRSRKVADLTHEVLAGFLASPDARLRPDGVQKKATSMNVLRGSLKSFSRYAFLAGHVALDPGRMMHRARCGHPPPRWLAQEEANQLLATIATERSSIAKRDLIFVQLLLGTGVRLSTALALRSQDVDVTRRLLVLREMKGNAPDMLPISVTVAAMLQTYLQDRPPGPLFEGEKGRPLGRRQAARRLEIWGERAGLVGRVHAHALRHSFARRLYEKTGDVLTVQALLRHRSIASTMIYAKVDLRDLRRALA